MVIAKSEPETLNVRDTLSASVAVTVPIDSWFSGAENIGSEVKTGSNVVKPSR